MKTFICLWFVLLVLSVVDLSLCGDPVNVTVIAGQNVNLLCRAAGNGKVSVVMLTRDDLKPDSVLLYRNEQIDEEQQHPQYKDRTKLQSLISTDGEINLILNNVTEKDSGEYKCCVMTEIKSNTRRKRAAVESSITTIIHLRVDPGRGHNGLVAGLVVVLVVALTAVFVLKKRRSFHSLSPHDEAEKPQNVDIRRSFLFSHDSNPAIGKPMRTFCPDAGPKPGQMERVV